MKYFISIYIITFCLSVSATMIPKNDLNIPASYKGLTDIDEVKFNEILDSLEGAYRPLIESQGNTFTVERDWEDGTVNAKAWKKGDNFFFKMYGGLARYETMTPDSYLLVGCHEVGHLIGGAPTIKPFNISSSEGQADYFSTLKCFRKVVRGQDHSKIIAEKPIHPLALSECGLSFEINSESYEICLRTNLANMAMARTFHKLRDLELLPAFDTPDPYVRMFIIFNGYPNSQCRMDTLFAGSLCNVSEEDNVDMNLYNKGVCSTIKNDKRGVRPLCWYVPREEDKQ